MRTGLPEFIQASQGRAFFIADLPDGLREAVAEYRPVSGPSGFRLLSSETLQNVLRQGQLMFWPANEEPPSARPPCIRTYRPIAGGRPIGVDLFAGAGGLSMGFEQAGFDVAACVEIDPVHCATHEYNFPYFDRDALTCSLRTVHTEASKNRFIETESGTTEPISRFFKLPPNGQCNTLRAGTDSARGAFTSPRPIHPALPRVITVREAARLHSYPDWFRFHATKWHGFRQIGNSVPPLLGRAVAGCIMRALGVTPSKPNALIETGDAALLTFTMRQAADHFGLPASVIGQRKKVCDSMRRNRHCGTASRYSDDSIRSASRKMRESLPCSNPNLYGMPPRESGASPLSQSGGVNAMRAVHCI